MISEHMFASSYTSVWHKLIPLADNYWRSENAKVPVEVAAVSNVAPARLRGFINELAFEVFRKVKLGDVPVARNLLGPIISSLVPDVAAYILRITNDENSVLTSLSDNILEEVVSLATNLLDFFEDKEGILFRPKFSGCGVVSSCEGDLIYKGCLYEIKAGDRSFRIGDIKQLLVYSTLAYAGDDNRFSYIGLFNPRSGHHWKKNLDELCTELSGIRKSDILSNIATSMSQLAVSR